jgi:hypothetical protein
MDPAWLLERLTEDLLGTRQVMGEVFWKRSGNSDTRYPAVKSKCTACGLESELNIQNVLRGLSKNCVCQKTWQKYRDKRQKILAERYEALHQRCENPNSQSYSNYGARGIRDKFGSRSAFISWMMENLPHPTYRGVQIDRIDNNGHYEPGNMRLVLQVVNLCNKRNNRKVTYRGIEVVAPHLWHLLKDDDQMFPLSARTVARLVKEGMDPEDIMKHRRTIPGGRPSTISLTPDPAIVSLYRVK